MLLIWICFVFNRLHFNDEENVQGGIFYLKLVLFNPSEM